MHARATITPKGARPHSGRCQAPPSCHPGDPSGPLTEVDNPRFYKENARLFEASSIRSRPLANSKSAEKRARQAIARRSRNVTQRSQARTSIKRVVTAVQAGDKEQAADALKAAQPVIDAMARKGIIHKNKAARHKSRLNKRIKALAGK